jgi:hypothetical protein
MNMTSVGVWQPDEHHVTLDEAAFERFAAAAACLEQTDFGLTPLEIERYAALMRLPAADWAPLAASASDERLVALVKFFTLAEMRLPGWEALARSPVVPLVAELKRRKGYPNELTAWIKANTTNRFLPYGSLLDKL